MIMVMQTYSLTAEVGEPDADLLDTFPALVSDRFEGTAILIVACSPASVNFIDTNWIEDYGYVLRTQGWRAVLSMFRHDIKWGLWNLIGYAPPLSEAERAAILEAYDEAVLND